MPVQTATINALLERTGLKDLAPETQSHTWMVRDEANPKEVCVRHIKTFTPHRAQEFYIWVSMKDLGVMDFYITRIDEPGQHAPVREATFTHYGEVLS